MREDEITKKVSLDREGMTPTDCAGPCQCSECEEVISYRAEEPAEESEREGVTCVKSCWGSGKMRAECSQWI